MAKKRYSTLKEISEKLNLNVSTVSRALKEHPDISLETRKRVQEMASLLDYKPNTFATSLRTNQTKLLGIIVSSITNLFYDSFIGTIEEKAREDGYSVLILQSGENVESELKNLEILKKNRVDGIFVSITSNTKDVSAFMEMEKKGIPIVFFDRVPLWETCNKVCFDDVRAAELAAWTIIQKKKKKVLGLFGISVHISTTFRRLNSFKNIFELNAPETFLDIRFHDGIEEAEKIVSEVLNSSDLPDTIFCMGDITLIGTMMAINKNKIKVPEQISVINMSNGFIPHLFNPIITYIETSGHKLGIKAFQKMMEIFENPDIEMEEVFVEPVFVEGASF